MRLVFVCWPFEDQGSSLVIQGYSEVARELGHEVAVYACPYDKIPLNYSIDVGPDDAVVFLFEWTTKQYYGDSLDLARLVGKVPRRRRVIIDGDGNYNDVIQVDGDENHPDAESSRRWKDICNSLSDKICQPTYHPLRSDVLPFLFYAYNRAGSSRLTGGRRNSPCFTWVTPSRGGGRWNGCYGHLNRCAETSDARASWATAGKHRRIGRRACRSRTFTGVNLTTCVG
jgi:hypothetical protein